jgi:branched-chain amino acid transport system substrate-binding protein
MTMKTRRTVCLSVSVVTVVFFLAGLGMMPPMSASGADLKGEVKIGVLLPLTGRIASEGNRQLQGYEVMREIINDWGGIGGKELVYVIADGPDPTSAANEVNRLITQQKVQLITGTYSSSLCVPASEVAARNRVTYWEVSCVDPRFNSRGLPYVWRTEIDAHGFAWYSTEFITKTLASQLGMQVKDIRLAFVSEDSAYGQGVTEYGRNRAKELGMQVVSVDYYNAGKITDFTPMILKLKSLKPDIIHGTPYTQDAILFWKQAKEHDLNVKAVVHTGAVGFGSPDFGKAYGKDADGVLALLEPIGLNPDVLSAEAGKWQSEVDRRYEQKYGEPPPGAAQLSIAGMYILKLVLEKAGSLDPDKIRQAALSLDIPVGGALMGWGVKFQENGQNANEIVQHYMNQWQNGKLVTVWPEKYATAPQKFTPLPTWEER